VNDLYELLMLLVKLGVAPEDITDKLESEFDFETIVLSDKRP